MKKNIPYILLALFVLFPGLLWAHGGSLDASGCHHNRKTGDYHCHRGASALSPSPTQKKGTTAPDTDRNGEAGQSFSGKVVGVSDGDTIKVMRSGREVKIRLEGIDCPEKRQAFGQKAKAFTSDLVFNEVVSVKVKETDRYGRLVAEVFLEDGRSLNRELVKAGLAWWYRQYSKDETLGELETAARENRVGLWQDKAPMAPWAFRRLKKK